VPDEDGEFMVDHVIQDNLLFVVAGGYETSSNTMAIALKYLAENPSILEQVLKGEAVRVQDLQFVGLIHGFIVIGINTNGTCTLDLTYAVAESGWNCQKHKLKIGVVFLADM